MTLDDRMTTDRGPRAYVVQIVRPTGEHFRFRGPFQAPFALPW
jgi:hypothetical protein